MYMPLSEATEIVLRLAREHIPEKDKRSDEDKKKLEATNIIEDYFVNEVFDGTDEQPA